MTKPPVVAVFGPLPPALTGAASCTGAILEHLVRRGAHVHQYPLHGLGGPISARMANRARSLASRLTGLVRARPDAVYFSLESNAGKALAIPVLDLCRRMKLPTFIHHHGYSYVGTHSSVIPIILRAAPAATHIFQCPTMAEEFHTQYAHRVHSTLTLTNAFLVPARADTARVAESRGQVTLGFMSGSHPVEKGLLRALAVAAETRKDRPTTLAVAGPLDSTLTSHVEMVAKKQGVKLKLLGPIVENKPEFFQQLDYLLFPSMYRNETQGIVNLEAMAQGTPVIGIAQCCVGETIEPFGGKVFAHEATFLSDAPEFILKTSATATSRVRARLGAQKQFKVQAARSTTELAALMDAIIAGARTSH